MLCADAWIFCRQGAFQSFPLKVILEIILAFGTEILLDLGRGQDLEKPKFAVESAARKPTSDMFVLGFVGFLCKLSVF